MEKQRSPARREKPKRKKLSDPAYFMLGLAVPCLTALDFYIHSEGGVSDPARRTQMAAIFGETIINHIGNFGFAAALSIIVTGGKKVFQHIDTLPTHENIYDTILEINFFLARVVIIAGVLTIEGFRDNNHFWGDIAATILGIESARILTDETLHRVSAGLRDNVRNHVDSYRYLNSVPTKVDALGYLSNTPTHAD